MKILFICLGNICRSPMAEGLFRHHITQLGLDSKITVDSCGTGAWHKGELPDKRMRDTAEKNGIILTHKARQLHINDFNEFDFLLVMDKSNYEDVLKVNKNKADKIKLMSDLSTSYKGKIIPDPYFGEMSDFESVFELLNNISEEIAKNIHQQYH